MGSRGKLLFDLNEHTTDVNENVTVANTSGACHREEGEIFMEPDTCAKEDTEEQGLRVKLREVKGIEASHAIKCSNTTVKRKMDQHKEAMLGKKRNRQTMFLNIDDVKQSTPRRQNFEPPIVTRSSAPAEHGGEILSHGLCRDQKPIDVPSNAPESAEHKSESSGKPMRLNGDEVLSAERDGASGSRQASWKQPKSNHSAGRKFSSSQSSFKKPAQTSTQYQDTSVERLIREVTSEKFWHHPDTSLSISTIVSVAFL